jgi:membrane-associated phospholipid phosphatase
MFLLRNLTLAIAFAGLMPLTLLAQVADSGNRSPLADAAASAQQPSSESSKTKMSVRASEEAKSDAFLGEDPDNRLIMPFVKHLAGDQRTFWTAPAHFRVQDLRWAVPFVGATAAFMAGDTWMSKQIPLSKVQTSKTISDYGVYSLIAAGGGAFVLGHLAGDDHMSEAGLLSGEAAINSTAVAFLMKSASQRPRPFQANGSGTFFQGGTSFPSEHAAIAWSVASVMAHEYPGTLTKILAYGLATGISATRVTGQQHFASDVIIGSALGWYFGRQVYRAHHDTDLVGDAWGDLVPESSGDKERNPANMGSPYVPLDSWVYPALERLIALGYIKNGSLGIRPWTRMECARLLEEVAAKVGDEEDDNGEAARYYRDLSAAFARETARLDGAANIGANVESVYFRGTNISGAPLRDGYHFGQTILNDYGRPYQEGFNTLAGASGWATAGPFVIYTRGEYQSAPSAPSLPQAALNFIANVDGLPPNPPSAAFASTSRFQLLDAYVGMNLANWQFSFGRRSLWWGPSESGAMIFTDNIAPLNSMFSVDRVTSFRLPWFLGNLGDIRLTAFIGQLSGQEFLARTYSGQPGPEIGQYGHELRTQPFLSGARITFKVTPNFEFGTSKTTIYGGPGLPLNFTTLFKSVLGIHARGDVLGDGRSGADFSYRIPKMRDWLTFYGETMSDDEPSPIPYMRQSIFQGGLYFAKLPGLPKLDLRLEGGTSSAVNYNVEPSGYFYWNAQYVNGYTNDGGFIGTWLGRAAQGEAIRTNYWLSPKRKIGLELRHRKLDREFLTQGGTQNDVAINADIYTGAGFRFMGNVQYERWQIPLLAASRQANLAATFEVGFWPARH